MTDNTEPTIEQLLDLPIPDKLYTGKVITASLDDLVALISDQVAKARIDELQRLDRSIEEHPNWGFRDWHETNFMETILADRIAELRSTQ